MAADKTNQGQYDVQGAGPFEGTDILETKEFKTQYAPKKPDSPAAGFGPPWGGPETGWPGTGWPGVGWPGIWGHGGSHPGAGLHHFGPGFGAFHGFHSHLPWVFPWFPGFWWFPWGWGEFPGHATPWVRDEEQ